MLRGACLVQGRGEAVADVETTARTWALVTFDFGVATADAYGWWDEDGGATGRAIDPIMPVLRDGSPEQLGLALFNDLEPSVVSRHPEIGHAKHLLLAGGAVGAVMSGSGPSVAGLLADDRPLAAKIQHEIERVAGRPLGYVTSVGAPSSL
jgi:4-diphosphocytidyl-2-C-methyl-D-erythritol kinase